MSERAAAAPWSVRSAGSWLARVHLVSALEALAALAVLGLAVALRVVNLEGGIGDMDEGIRGSQLMLMQAGYRPFQEIHASQGPLLLDLLAPFYRAFGGGLAGLRFAIGLFSLVGIVGAYWVTRQIAGPVGAVLAALFLTLSPAYLRFSRLAVAETVTLGPAILAVGAAVAYQRTGRWLWLLAGGLLFGLSLAIKPITIAAAAPIALLVVLRPGRRLSALLALGAVALGLVLLATVAVGWSGLWAQLVEYRLRTNDLQNWRLDENWKILRGALARDQLPIFVIAFLGGAALLKLKPRAGGPLTAWALGSFVLLLYHSPLFIKHTSLLMPPLAILAGAGLGLVSGRWAPRRGVDAAGRLFAVALLAWYAWSLPALLTWDARHLDFSPPGISTQTNDIGLMVRAIEAMSQPTDFILTDFPYLAFLAERLVPPPIVDTAKTRIRTGDLTDEEIAAAASAYPSKLAVLWSDRFRPLRRFRSYLFEHYQSIAVYGRGGDPARFIYLRRDADFEQARGGLAGSLPRPSGVEFAGELRLTRFGLEAVPLSPNGGLVLATEWEAIKPLEVDYHVVTRLIGPDDLVWGDGELSVFEQFGRGENEARWPSGRWIVQVVTLALPPDAPRGTYHLMVEVHDTRTRRPTTLTFAPGFPTAPGQTELLLATWERE